MPLFVQSCKILKEIQDFRTDCGQAGHFHLIFSQYVGSNFPADFLQKIETFAFHRLLNIFGAVSADNRSPTNGKKLGENA